MMLRGWIWVTLLAAFTGCTATDTRFDAATPPEALAPVSVPFARIEVVAVSLPVYAQSEEIHLRDETGAIVPLGPLWADEPTRALTLEVARGLDAVTNRLVAPEPWPFRDLPDVRVDVRLDAFLATQAGNFRMAGQVFVAPEEGLGRDRARSFDIVVPVGDPTSAAAIADARARAVQALVKFIAEDGLR